MAKITRMKQAVRILGFRIAKSDATERGYEALDCVKNRYSELYDAVKRYACTDNVRWDGSEEAEAVRAILDNEEYKL